MQAENLANRRFGKLTVWARVKSSLQGQARWFCRCSCGNDIVVNASRLKAGKTRSCGCLRREESRKRALHHGEGSRQLRSAEYVTWLSMKGRCLNPRNRSYKNYGGRGVKICKRWLKFENFLMDMGRRPSQHSTVERVDVDKGYSPKNCKWATRKEQANNKRSNRRLEYRGRTETLSRWADILGVPSRRLQNRLAAGWTVDRAFSEPPRRW